LKRREDRCTSTALTACSATRSDQAQPKAAAEGGFVQPYDVVVKELEVAWIASSSVLTPTTYTVNGIIASN